MSLPNKRSLNKIKQMVAKAHEAPRSKAGRKALLHNRNIRTTICLTEETNDRLQFALLKEKIKRRKQLGLPIDKSYIFEEALVTWLNEHKY